MKEKATILLVILLCLLAVSSKTAQLVTIAILWSTNLVLGVYLLIRFLIRRK